MSFLSMAAKLSERELSILRLISYGQSDAEAAAHLKIGAKTVKHHLKLGNAQAQSTRSRASRRPSDSGRLDELTRADLL